MILPLLSAATIATVGQPSASEQRLVAGPKPVIHLGSLAFKDLNANGRVDPYEDWRLSPDRRASDLLRRMTLAEKAGTMMHGTLPMPGGPFSSSPVYDGPAAQALVNKGIGSFITRLAGGPAQIAAENNKVQAFAEATRLGIPVIVSTDPRNQFQTTAGQSVAAGGFTVWPDPLGLAAAGDPHRTFRLAEVARQEYRAVGIQMALSPQADLATEPRWSRVSGTFGEEPERVAEHVSAYVEGFQGGRDGVSPGSVATVVKHWVGYGAAKDGWDSHSRYGRFATFPGGAFDQHITPFKAAFKVKASAVMPTYSILEGLRVANRPIEQVGAAFNKQLVTGLLRGGFGYTGVVISDWSVTNDCDAVCDGGWKPTIAPVVGMPWGVETLSRTDRFAKAINAGVDQIGGSEEAELIVAAVTDKKISVKRIDAAVRSLLRLKFELGLFEKPYVDASAAELIVAQPAFVADALDAQRHSMVLLQNKGVLPLAAGTKVLMQGVDPKEARSRGLQPVNNLKDADVVIMRLSAPFENPHKGYLFGMMAHEGDLDFKDGDPSYEALKTLSAQKPIIATIYLERPAILGPIVDRTSALIGNFGVSDSALLDLVVGRAAPTGKLPVELPSSMAEVRAQRSDVPHDTANPLFPIGFGLSYPNPR